MDANYIMPWGMHKGKALANVPDSYLLWLYEDNKAHGQLKEYIKLNLAAIRTNISRSNRRSS